MIILIRQFLKEVFEIWRLEFQTRKFRWLILISLVAVIPFFLYLKNFLTYIEQRSGCDLNDLVLSGIPAMDVSKLIFFILYTSAVVMIFYCIRQPWLLVRGIHVLIILQYLRNICLYLTPLNAPVDIFPLHDPILGMIAYNQHSHLKDLFFSGHTATIFIFVLLTWNSPGLRVIFGFLTVLMAILLLIQHCHYTVDIIGGVACAYLSFSLVSQTWIKIQLPMS